MKTFEEFMKEAASDLGWSIVGHSPVAEEAAKRYAAQCVKDALERAAESIKEFAGVGVISIATVKHTKIITP